MESVFYNPHSHPKVPESVRKRKSHENGGFRKSVPLLKMRPARFLKTGHASFSLFSSFLYTVDTKQMLNINKFLPLTGFEPRTSGIRSNRSTNWATENMFVLAIVRPTLSRQVTNIMLIISAQFNSLHVRQHRLTPNFDQFWIVFYSNFSLPTFPTFWRKSFFSKNWRSETWFELQNKNENETEACWLKNVWAVNLAFAKFNFRY